MRNLLVTNIGCLVNVRGEDQLLRGSTLSQLPCIENAYLLIEDGIITGFGKMQEISVEQSLSEVQQIDAAGAYILPCWCDSHTHLVFAASREEEFTDKIKGLSYAEIAARWHKILPDLPAGCYEDIMERKYGKGCLSDERR